MFCPESENIYVYVVGFSKSNADLVAFPFETHLVCGLPALFAGFQSVCGLPWLSCSGTAFPSTSCINPLLFIPSPALSQILHSARISPTSCISFHTRASLSPGSLSALSDFPNTALIRGTQAPNINRLHPDENKPFASYVRHWTVWFHCMYSKSYFTFYVLNSYQV